MDRSKENSHINLIINITFWILNENQNYKAQHAHGSKIYKTHSIISTIARFEFQPSQIAELDLGVFRPRKMETEALQCSGSWMDEGMLINLARSCSNQQLPLMKLDATVQDSARKWRILASIFFSNACEWWNKQRSCKVYEKIAEKWREKVESKMWFWSRSGSNGMLMPNSVRIILIYGGLMKMLIKVKPNAR